jgi:hypothetical protein
MRKEAGQKDPTHPRPFMNVEENQNEASAATVSISKFNWHET